MKTKYAVGYARVSTEKQADQGVSLEEQERSIKTWAEENDHVLLGPDGEGSIYLDAGRSGKDVEHRPGFQAALARVGSLGATFVVYDYFRAGRSLHAMLNVAHEIEAVEGNIVSLTPGEDFDTTTAAGELYFHMMLVIGEFMRKKAAENTRRAMESLQRRGYCTGGLRPYGYDVVMEDRGDGTKKMGKKVVNEAEFEVISRIVEMGETESTHRIARILTEEGIPGPTGGKWNHVTVGNLIRKFGSQGAEESEG